MKPPTATLVDVVADCRHCDLTNEETAKEIEEWMRDQRAARVGVDTEEKPQ